MLRAVSPSVGGATPLPPRSRLTECRCRVRSAGTVGRVGGVRFVDEIGFAFGWIAPEPRFMQRASHAVAAHRCVWLIDPVADESALGRARELGEPAGVVQLLDRHGRDCRYLDAAPIIGYRLCSRVRHMRMHRSLRRWAGRAGEPNAGASHDPARVEVTAPRHRRRDAQTGRGRGTGHPRAPSAARVLPCRS
jgi:hypothetical protein